MLLKSISPYGEVIKTSFVILRLGTYCIIIINWSLKGAAFYITATLLKITIFYFCKTLLCEQIKRWNLPYKTKRCLTHQFSLKFVLKS